MAPRYKDGGGVLFSLNGRWVSIAHTLVAYAAFLGALVVGMWLHFHKIVQNEYYGYPQEWFPSVSATIGDRYPERSVFQVFIAITSGPRFALCFLWYFLSARPNAVLPKFLLGVGLFRTLTCGGWTYITSTDDHDWHDIFMISYLVATVPWTACCIALSPRNAQAVKYRKRLASMFFGTLVPLIYFYIQHKVHKVPGAYTKYAFLEWSLILFDVAFDAVTALDFRNLEIVVKDYGGISRGHTKTESDAFLEREKDKPVVQTFSGRFSWPALWDALADVYNGFVFWTILTSLGVLVWYFPLWYMGISGWEIFVMTTLSPFLLGIHPLRAFIIRNIRACHLLSLSALLAYLIEGPELRLCVVGFSVSMTCLSWTATWYSERLDPARLEARASAWALGLLASSIAKFAFQTTNPIWPIVHPGIGGWNKFGFFLAVIAVFRTTRTSLVDYGLENFEDKRNRRHAVLAGLGWGGLMFALHSLLSDSSTMISWVWEGYPIRGPIAVPHGAYVLAAMGIGFILGLFRADLITSWTAFGIGSVGAASLTWFSHWTGFYGALVFSAYLTALVPFIIRIAVRYNHPAVTFGTGFFIYNLMVLFHVWVVAYAFVPGGPLLREHTDWIMTITMILIGVGVFVLISAEKSDVEKHRRLYPSPRSNRSYYLYILVGLQLWSAAIAYLRFPTFDYKPYHPEEKLVTAGIWTTHFSLDNDMYTSETRMRDLIKDMEIDVIGLLESDLQRIIMGNRDTTQFLAEDLGMYADYGPGPNKHTWGAALLSKFPIINSTHHLTPSPVGEIAPIIHATLDMYGEFVDVVVFHSGQEEDVEDRRLQTEYLSKVMAGSPRPMILLSYLVTKPLTGNYNTHVSNFTRMKDIDRTDWDRWCEYILYRDIKRVGYARVSRSTITDTELQVGKFVVGQPDGPGKRIKEDKVPYGRRFPTKLRGEGVRGHFYHVFNEPRYFD